MRGIGNHKPPRVMQVTPRDNTTPWCLWQAYRWASHTTALVHTEVAREIAAWWQEGSNGFAQFQSTGTIVPGFVAEIEAQLLDDDNNLDDVAALRALLAYVWAVRRES